MTAWDVLTWVAIAILGPGALIVFVAFLRDLLRPAPRPPSDDAVS